MIINRTPPKNPVELKTGKGILLISGKLRNNRKYEAGSAIPGYEMINPPIISLR